MAPPAGAVNTVEASAAIISPRKIRNVKPGRAAQRAQQAELLAEGGEDEVGGALGDELQVGLRAVR